MNCITQFQKWLGLAMATACIVIALNGFPPVQAQSPAKSGFTSAKTAKTAQFTIPTAPTVMALDTPQQPSGERAIIM